MIVLQSIIPMTAFAIMFRLYLRGHAKPIDKFILVVFVMMRVIVGMYSGWIGMTAAFVITSAAVYISERRKVPYLVLGALVIFVLFFQAGKEDYRQYYWAKGVEASKAERITGWMNESLLRWEEALTDTTGQTSRDLANISLSRVSLLTQTANVIELTPSMVPYQYGSLYSYFGVTLIPRFVWPDKPSINEANTFYQSAYGIAYENNQTEVSIAVGTLAEGYINFGWLGVVAVMFLLGVFFDFFRRCFIAPESGMLFGAIGMVLLPSLLLIESQLSVYLSGIIQQLLLIFVVFLPVIRFKKLRWRVGKSLSGQDAAAKV